MSSAEYKKNYYENNKDKLKDYYKTKVKCNVCGAVYSRSSVTQHLRTKKHLDAADDLTRKYKILKKKYYLLKYATSDDDTHSDSD